MRTAPEKKNEHLPALKDNQILRVSEINFQNVRDISAGAAYSKYVNIK